MKARRRPPRVTTSRSWASCSPNSASSAEISDSKRVALHRQLDRGRRALQPVEVLAEREGPPGVEPDHLEDPVPAKQSIVRGRDTGLRRLGNSSIDTGQFRRAHAQTRLSEPQVRHLTEIVVRDPRCQGDLGLAQLIRGSIQYTKYRRGCSLRGGRWSS